jgi:hypothetical protein
MKRVISVSAAIVAALLLVQTVRADVKTKERVTFQLAGALGKIVNFFAGSAAKEGVVSTVAVKGSRKSSMTESTGQIIDLSEEKVYDLDIKKKEYKVTTFAEMRKRLQEEREKAEKQAKSAGPEDKSDPEKSGKEIEFEASVKETGQKKQIAGYDTKEVVLTITAHEKGKKIEDSGGIILTNDMWMGPKIAALNEIGEFDMKYFQAVYGQAFGVDPRSVATVIAMFPSFQKMAQQMQGESGKLQGTALYTTITFEGMKSAEEMKSAGASQSSTTSTDSSSGGGGLAGKLGGLMSRGKGASSSQPQQKSTIFTSVVERLSIEPSATADDVAVPAGFKEKK